MHDLKSEMSCGMSQGAFWLALKAAFLLTLSAILIFAALLVIQGEQLTRRASGGLAVLPPVIVFYILRFKYVEYSKRSIAAHIGTVLCACVIGLCIFIHKSNLAQFKSVNFTLILSAITVALFGFGICLICVLSFANYGRLAKVRPPYSKHARRKVKKQCQSGLRD